MDYLRLYTETDPDEPGVELVVIEGDHSAFQWMISAAGNARDGFTATTDEQPPAAAGELETRRDGVRRRLVLRPQTPNEREQKRLERLSIHKLHERNAALAKQAGARGSVTLTTRAAEAMGADAIAALTAQADVRIEEPAIHLEDGPSAGGRGNDTAENADGLIAPSTLSVDELHAVLRNDTGHYPDAGRVIVPAAYAELQARAAAEGGEDQATAAKALADVNSTLRKAGGNDTAAEPAAAGQAADQAGRGDAYEGPSS